MQLSRYDAISNSSSFGPKKVCKMSSICCILVLTTLISSSLGFSFDSIWNKRYNVASRCTHCSGQNILGGKGIYSGINLYNKRLDDDDDAYDNAAENTPIEGPEKSLMGGYIAKFLQKQRNEDNSSLDDDNSIVQANPTHLIALPMDNCHNLMLELESVQRAILYHCPLLVHACITQSMARLPLLYVTTNADDAATTAKLQSIVDRAVQATINIQTYETQVDKVQRSDNVDSVGVNNNGVMPLMLKFAKLDVDGPNNHVLHTVAQTDDVDSNGIDRLQAFVECLQSLISKEELSWTTMRPKDESVDAANQVKDETSSNRLRLPFMRLPADWNTHIYANRPVSTDGSDDDDDTYLSSDEGGNGISPIFWCQWWDDVFGQERMREVAIYKAKQQIVGESMRLDEDTFRLPEFNIMLPVGNDALTRQEKQAQDYFEQRMRDAEKQMESDKVKADIDSNIDNKYNGYDESQDELLMNSSNDDVIDENDPMLAKTRSRLEELFKSTASDPKYNIVLDDVANQDTDVKNKSDSPSTADNAAQLTKTGNPASDNDDLDDWTKQRIQATIAARAKARSERELATPKNNPPIADNPIFSRYKNNTLVDKKPLQVDTTTTTTKNIQDLPPFPSREHVIGFWQVTSSPTGFDVEEGDPTRSDNLVLRADGTIAGGPILDQETRQKASGGTWTLVKSGANTVNILRIRLVIPPKKERILVMQGIIQQGSSLQYSMPSSTFGIPQLEELAKSAADNSIYCNGDVWLEDAVTGKNRDSVGKFSITKLNLSNDPSQYTITIPKSVRNQD